MRSVGEAGEESVPHKRTTPKIFHRARELRLNQTEAETKLWGYLRGHRLNGLGFRRQHALGTYIVDFCCPQKMLVVEIDGSQHLEQEEYDAERTAWLESQGWRVLRFNNREVMQETEAVLTVILEACS